MKKQILAALIATASAIGGHAQTFPAAWGSRLQAVLDSVNTYNQNSVGITAAVYFPGYGLWKGATGISAPGEPMTTDMRVLIGSNSKLFTAVTMLKLQEAGTLNLNDHISKWIHYNLTGVDTSATIRQLLGHQSGMSNVEGDYPDAYNNIAFVDDTSAIVTARQIVDSALAPFYPKGRGWHYSNTGYSLCTMIIEAATGQPYWQNLRDHVLTPLSLDSTYVPVFEPYQPIAGTNIYGTLYTGYFCTSFATASPGNGEVASTPQQMVEWYQKLFNGQFLAPASMKELLTFEPSVSYSLGLNEIISPRLGPEYYHSGAVGAFTSEVMLAKDTRASVFIALNTVNDSVSTYQYIVPLLDVLTKEMPKKVNDAGITALVSPRGITCNTSTTPMVTLKNFGSATLTSVNINLQIDGTAANTYNWTGTLLPGATTDVTLATTALTNGMHNLNIYTLQPNGAAEGYTFNDTFRAAIGANLTTPYTGYFTEDFEGGSNPLLIWGSDNGMEGQAGVSQLSGYKSGHCLVRNCVNNPKYGDVSNIDLPAVNLTPGSSPVFSFRYAYRNLTGQFGDSLQALISTDCGSTWTSLFYKGGEDLSGGITDDDLYYPQSDTEWKSVNIPLTSYSGDALIRFRQTNGQGQDVFIDDITVGKPVSVSNMPAQQKLTVFPNPAQAQVTISGLPVNTAVSLTDITGKLIKSTIGNSGNVIIDVNSLTPGIYLLRSAYGTMKFVKD